MHLPNMLRNDLDLHMKDYLDNLIFVKVVIVILLGFSLLDSEWPDVKARFEHWLELSNFDQEGQQIKHLNDF